MVTTETKILTTLAASIFLVPVPVTGNANTIFISYIDYGSTHVSQIAYSETPEDTYIYNALNDISQYDKVTGELLSYANLLIGWDGGDGIVPSQKTIDTTLHFMELIKKQSIASPKVMLSSNGDISLYWEIDGVYLEAAFDDENRLSYLIDSSDKTMGEDDLLVDDFIPPTFYRELVAFPNELNELSI